MALFKMHLNKLLDILDPISGTIAVMGDFNDNILTHSTVCHFMTAKGYIQVVSQPTTGKGTLIDHVYIKTTQYDTQTIVLPAYFSDHDAIVCSFSCKTAY